MSESKCTCCCHEPKKDPENFGTVEIKCRVSNEHTQYYYINPEGIKILVGKVWSAPTPGFLNCMIQGTTNVKTVYCTELKVEGKNVV